MPHGDRSRWQTKHLKPVSAADNTCGGIPGKEAVDISLHHFSVDRILEGTYFKEDGHVPDMM